MSMIRGIRFRHCVVGLFLSLPGMSAALVYASGAPVVNPAPEFVGGADAGRAITLQSLKGKPVILLFAASPRDHAFRAQLNRLKGSYEHLAAQGALFFAACSSSGRIPSNIPFILVNNPATTAAAYDVGKGFSIAIIGRDGNLDCISPKPLPGQRILDLVMNNASLQEQLRR